MLFANAGTAAARSRSGDDLAGTGGPRRMTTGVSSTSPPTSKPSLVAQVERVRALERQTGPIIPYLFPHFAGQHWGERIKDFVSAVADRLKKG